MGFCVGGWYDVSNGYDAVMSGYVKPSEFPSLNFILQWGNDSQHGLCCGIFGCTSKVAIKCKICDGWYCNEHKDWHKHTENFDGVIVRDD